MKQRGVDVAVGAWNRGCGAGGATKGHNNQWLTHPAQEPVALAQCGLSLRCGDGGRRRGWRRGRRGADSFGIRILLRWRGRIRVHQLVIIVVGIRLLAISGCTACPTWETDAASRVRSQRGTLRRPA